MESGINYVSRLISHFWAFQRFMSPDLDIYRSTQVLVKRHGQDAPLHAAMRADAMLEAGRPDFRFLVCFLPFS